MPELASKPISKRVRKLKLTPRPKPPNASDMSGPELWAKLQKIGFSQQGFARTIRVAEQTVRSWIGERSFVPETIAILVNLMLKTKSTPEDLGTANRNKPNTEERLST
jgi:DNA-binding transcriptional regulator YiaG